MPNSKASSSFSFAADYLIALRDYSLSKGISTRALIANSGMSLEDLLNPPERVNREQIHAAFKNIIKLLPPAHITALEYGRFIALSSHGFMGVAAQSCHNIREATEVLCRYIKTRSEVSLAQLKDTDEGLIVEISIDPRHQPNSDEDMERFFELLTTRNMDYFFTLAGGDDIPNENIKYRLVQKKPENFLASDYYLNGDVTFSNEAFEVLIPKSWLDIELSSNNLELKAIAIEKCKSELKKLSSGDLLNEIRDRLNAKEGMHLTIEQAAKQLFMSTSTLQRKLKSEGTTFQDLKQEERLKLSQNLLQNTRISIEDIAEQLGFSDGSNFAKSFKSWTNTSPAAYRKIHNQ